MLFRTGIDNYGLFPLGLEPIEVLQWARENGAEGVQFSGLAPEHTAKIDTACLKDLRQYAECENLYLEWGGGQHIPRDMTTWAKRDIAACNRKAVEEAAVLGTRVVRSCSGGLMRWDPSSPPTKTLLKETAEFLRSQQQMLRDSNVILAIETHFEFTTFELLQVFDMCEVEPGDCLGICLDTMNLLTMLEDPVVATERVSTWVVSTHVKDGGIRQTPDGFETFPTGIGQGVINLTQIIRRLANPGFPLNLSIEDHGGSFSLPIFNQDFYSEFPDLTGEELAGLIQLSQKVGSHAETGHCAETPHDEWPDVCEERMKQNIRALKEIVAGLGETDTEAV